jgi:hypothetical protein
MTQEKTITIRINHNDKTKITNVSTEYSSNGVNRFEMAAAVIALIENHFIAELLLNEQAPEQHKVTVDKLIETFKKNLRNQLDVSIREICIKRNSKIDKNAFSLENIINSSKSLH